MLDINLLRNDIDAVAASLSKRGFVLDIAYFKELEQNRKLTQSKLEALQAKRNALSKEIGVKKAHKEDVKPLVDMVNAIASERNLLEVEFGKLKRQMDDLLYSIPNLLVNEVPFGNSEADNHLIRTVGKVKQFTFAPKDHVDLGINLDGQMNFAIASKLAGSRFVVLYDKIAKLHRALGQFMLDVHTNHHGYHEVYVPYLANAEAMLHTGQLPKFVADLFSINRGGNPMAANLNGINSVNNQDGINEVESAKRTHGNSATSEDLYLIPTAEVPLTNLVANLLLKDADLPLKFVAHTPCFRSEAGSYGKDTRGMIRMHQFDKVELVQIVKPHDSLQALEELTRHAEYILQLLELPYRVMLLCGADIGFSAAKTYDLEVWLPSQNTYREISSCSLMSDYQARRMQARYKNATTNKNDLLHTLNGSGLAIGRTLVALIENYQNEDGSITIPHVLREYTGFASIEVRGCS